VGERLERAGLLRSSLDLLFARTLRDAFALEVAGDFHRFGDVMAGSLQVLFAFGRQREPEAIDRTLRNVTGSTLEEAVGALLSAS
jgi:hypothetical protein